MYADALERTIPADWPRSGRVEFRNVTVRYTLDGPDILKDINLVFNAGERVAIVGRTGSGKSTVSTNLVDEKTNHATETDKFLPRSLFYPYSGSRTLSVGRYSTTESTSLPSHGKGFDTPSPPSPKKRSSSKVQLRRIWIRPERFPRRSYNGPSTPAQQ